MTISDPADMEDFRDKIRLAAELVKSSRFCIAFTGAGISTGSGLSDFRSPGGLWDRYRIVTYQEFLASHEGRVEYWKMRSELIPQILGAKPNKAHRALAELERLGKLRAVITQNIDGLHQEAGNSRVVELHGTNRTALCLGCGKTWPIAEIQKRLESGDLDPRCDRCRGIIKPATVSFGQPMPEAAMTEAFELASRCDLLLMIGSSLEVQPAASIPAIAHEKGAQLIFINRTPTPYDSLARFRFENEAGEFLTSLLDAVQE